MSIRSRCAIICRQKHLSFGFGSNGKLAESSQPRTRGALRNRPASSILKILKRGYIRIFRVLDRVGVHVLPKHYYTPVPDYAWLQKNPEAWIHRLPLTGINWDLDRQSEWLTEICEPYYQEVSGEAGYSEMIRRWGDRFGLLSSQVLHCVIRAKAPARIIEIGSGTSTHCMLYASTFNQQAGKSASKITCIEPHPSKDLRTLPNVDLLELPCQMVPNSVFAQLRAGDMLFIDSSHSVKVGSDVIRIYLDIIPQLSPGILIHIHDINLPYAYPRSTLLQFFGWQETALLVALLTNNTMLAVLGCLSALHYDRTARLKNLLTDYQPQPNHEGLCPSYPPPGHFPSSLWLITQ